MTYASRRGFANRQQARAKPSRAMQNLGRVEPSALVLSLVRRFFTSPDFPIDAWIRTTTSPKLKRAIEKLASELPVELTDADHAAAGA